MFECARGMEIGSGTLGMVGKLDMVVMDMLLNVAVHREACN